jgi:hypothetical protein
MAEFLNLSRGRIITALLALNVPVAAIQLADDYYVCPKRDWITGDFAAEWSGILTQLGARYRPEDRDCDDFARGAAYWAAEFWSQTPDNNDSGLAFGECWCQSRRHAFNVALHLDANGQLVVVAYEPQPAAGGVTFTRLALDPDDWKSVTLCRF